MPLNAKGIKVMAKLVKEYGEKKGRNIFYAMINDGKLTDVEKLKMVKKEPK